MKALKRFFLSRKTILAFILLILISVIIAYIFPQRFLTPPPEMERWKEANPSWALWIERLELDHVYSTPWFAVILFLFLISLTLSTFEQIKTSILKTFRRGALAGRDIKVYGPEEEIIKAIKRHGYLKTYGGNREFRFVKHPWGYWGNVLLHLGIAVVIASSLIIVLTEKRGLLHLVEGEVVMPGSPWLVEEKGMLVEGLVLLEAIKLKGVIPEFWETDDIKQLTTNIIFIDPQGRFREKVLAINQTLNYRGMRIYQSQRFGDAFFLELTDNQGIGYGSLLLIQNPERRDKASYGNFQFEEVPYLLKAKYFADAEKKTINSLNPLLVLRLVDMGKVIGEVSLIKGESRQLGPYTARLVDVSRWAGIIFVDITGMPGIFLGFFIIILGGGLTYFMPPREFYLKKEDEGFSLTWKATRFENFYREEYERIIEKISGSVIPVKTGIQDEVQKEKIENQN